MNSMIRRALKTLTSPQLVENKKTLFFLVFLAMSAVLISFIQTLSLIKGLVEKDKLIKESTFNQLDNLRQQSANLVSSDALTLRFLSQSHLLQEYAESDSSKHPEIKQLFASLLVARPEIFQLRILNLKGQENLRVEKVNGKLIYTAAEELQDKSNRAYFRQSITLSAGMIHVSSLDLNMEHGEIQIPWRPTIRIATPITSDDGSNMGVLVININAERILGLYDKKEAAEVSYALFNRQGYWLHGVDASRLWGFMFSRKPDIPESHPNVWKDLSLEDRQIFKVGNKKWFIQPVSADDLFPDALQNKKEEKVLWYVLVEYKSSIGLMSIFGIVSVLAILTVLCVFSLAWVKSINRGFETRKELIKAEKLSSLGSLVAGVSHELGTPLGSALTMASTIEYRAECITKTISQGQIKKSEILSFIQDTQKSSQIMQKGLRRAADLIGHFKQVAVDQSAEVYREFAIDPYIEEMSATFMHLFKYRKINLVLDLKSNMKITSYPGSLSQVVINLVHNALVHGFEDDEEGIITISTRCIDEMHLEICVSDNGRGIPNDIVNRVFEPFFTTRLGSGGSGLGLHISRTIVMEVLRGTINVSSSPLDRITKARIVMPKKIKKLTSLAEMENGNHVEG